MKICLCSLYTLKIISFYQSEKVISIKPSDKNSSGKYDICGLERMLLLVQYFHMHLCIRSNHQQHLWGPTACTHLKSKRLGFLRAKRGFGQRFPNWLKLSNMVQQGPSALITVYCACKSNRNKLVDNQNLISSSRVGAWVVLKLK